MSSPEYPVYDNAPGAEPQPLMPRPPRLAEDPAWSGWDVLGIILLTVVSVVVFLFATTLVAQRVLFPRVTVVDVAKYPLVTVVAQLLAYLVVLAFMVMVVKRVQYESFWKAIRWNWPANPLVYLFGGVLLAFGLSAFAHLLPMPKELPIDRFFQTSTEAWALSIFGITMAPLLEELFFRGFLYPVLVRRAGIVVSVFVTSAAFALIHAPQLARAWGPLLVVFLVGVTLTVTRAVTKSVSAGMLIHIAYNASISALIFIATDGFRHLDKLNQ